MKKYAVTYAKLYGLYGKGGHEKEYSVTDDIFVKTPIGGFAKIHGVVSKHNHNIISVNFDDGDKFECSEDHLFLENGNTVRAKNVFEVDCVDGNSKKVSYKKELGKEIVYDISIDEPCVYVAKESSGIIHHNTFLLLKVVKLFLDKNPVARCIYFETEYATADGDLVDRDVDTDRCKILYVKTIQSLQKQINGILKHYNSLKKSEKYPLLLCVDSVGMLSTTKEISDLEGGEEKSDMGNKAKTLKAFFRTLVLELGVAGVDMICTNHTYMTMGLFSKKIMSGGSGIAYSPSIIVYLSKRRDKDGKEVLGSIVTSTTEKCRSAREGTKTELKIDHKRGLVRMYGVFEFCIEKGLITKIGMKYYFLDDEENKFSKKEIIENPKKFFNKGFLEKLNETTKKVFLYGSETVNE